MIALGGLWKLLEGRKNDGVGIIMLCFLIFTRIDLISEISVDIHYDGCFISRERTFKKKNL